ncbi:Hypp6119 [Branchiostoma lanceolatum]|uniref:Hypp6119 protein n=1 Tax=Branchiostoma lanceolatum TaxID=7740 RepID=A0A8J9W8W3_BRALA|nr:Hypp6119 [Branchiostoma lanceolatum]
MSDYQDIVKAEEAIGETARRSSHNADVFKDKHRECLLWAGIRSLQEGHETRQREAESQQNGKNMISCTTSFHNRTMNTGLLLHYYHRHKQPRTSRLLRPYTVQLLHGQNHNRSRHHISQRQCLLRCHGTEWPPKVGEYLQRTNCIHSEQLRLEKALQKVINISASSQTKRYYEEVRGFFLTHTTDREAPATSSYIKFSVANTRLGEGKRTLKVKTNNFLQDLLLTFLDSVRTLGTLPAVPARQQQRRQGNNNDCKGTANDSFGRLGGTFLSAWIRGSSSTRPTTRIRSVQRSDLSTSIGATVLSFQSFRAPEEPNFIFFFNMLCLALYHSSLVRKLRFEHTVPVPFASPLQVADQKNKQAFVGIQQDHRPRRVRARCSHKDTRGSAKGLLVSSEEADHEISDDTEILEVEDVENVPRERS